jgi:hypothetical protein
VADVGYHVKSFVTENLNLKLLSLAFALVLYSLVHAAADAQRSIKLSAVVLPPPPNRVLMTPIPDYIRVTVRGPRSTLDDLHADDIGSVQLDLRGGNETRVTVDPTMLPVPPGLKVEQIEFVDVAGRVYPPSIDLVWEDTIVRDVPVEVGVVGTPAAGFVVKGAPAADPAKVRAQGPKSDVSVLQHARADGFDVTGLTEGTYSRWLAIEPAKGKVSFDEQRVKATVEVGREVVERQFQKVPVSVLGLPKAKAQPAEVDARIACPPEVVRALRPEQVLPRVQVVSTAEHGSEAIGVQIAIDQCEVHVTPPSVIVRW